MSDTDVIRLRFDLYVFIAGACFGALITYWGLS